MDQVIWMGFTVVCAMAFLALSLSQGAWARRVAFAAGLLTLVGLELLGIIWPSPYTVAGLIALPCVVVFLVGLARPQVMARRWVVIYGSLAVLLAVVANAYHAGAMVALDANVRHREQSSEVTVHPGASKPPLAPPQPSER